MPEELNDLVRRDLGRIELPPAGSWIPPTRQRAPWQRSALAVPVAVGAMALALAIAVGVQLPRDRQSSNVATPPSPSPTTAAAPTPIPVPIVVPSSPFTGPVHVKNTLPAEGQWALVHGWGAATDARSSAVVAVRLDVAPTPSKPPLDLLWFRSTADGESPYPNNLLREQISPDGRQLVLSVSLGKRLGLVVVDLVAGTVIPLTTDPAFHDVSPAWNPQGDEIAFVRIDSRPGGAPGARVRFQHPDAGLWVVRADGTALRRVLDPANASHSYIYSWNAEGSAIGLSRAGGSGAGNVLPYEMLEIASGRITRIGTRLAAVTSTRAVGHWRREAPAFAGALTVEGGERQYIVTAQDQLGGGAREIFVSPHDASGSMSFIDARWRPGSNDLLFTRRPNPPGAATILILDAGSSSPREVATAASARLQAEWLPSGREIVYVQSPGISATMHIVGADGRNDRVLTSFTLPDTRIQWLDIAVVSY